MLITRCINRRSRELTALGLVFCRTSSESGQPHVTLFELLAKPVRRHHSSTLAVFRHLGVLGLFSLAILDSTPLPTFGGPDILIVILVVTRHNAWYECAAAATAGSVVGAYITFRLARQAGRAYLDSKFGQKKVPKLLQLFDRWGTGALVASTAIPFPSPTSVFFAAAGASTEYRTEKYLTVVALSRAFRYSAVAIIGELYGRHVIRVLRHPTQYWGWFTLIAAIFVALLAGGILLQRRLVQASA
jgi:membrane protein YqaA with SNARE-associated domain